MTNVNVFSVPMEMTKMINVTSIGNFVEGDIVSWSEATWEFKGSVKIMTYDFLTILHFPNTFKITNFHSWENCMNLCPESKPLGECLSLRTLMTVSNLPSSVATLTVRTGSGPLQIQDQRQLH